MSSIYYSAAWTECGCLISCWHEHKTVQEAASCIPCAGGYVVGVENGALRSLTAEEKSKFQRAVHGHSADNPAVGTTPAAPAEAAVTDAGYAVMTRIRVGDRWTWTTWMRFETYAEAKAHAREGNKVVRFGSSEWAALRQQTEIASPLVINAPRENLPPRGEGETLLEFILRLLSAYGFAEHAEPISDVTHSLTNTDMIDLVLSRLGESETHELEKMYAKDKHALLEALGNRFCTVLKSGGH
jgi:hypothetical protein